MTPALAPTCSGRAGKEWLPERYTKEISAIQRVGDAGTIDLPLTAYGKTDGCRRGAPFCLFETLRRKLNRHSVGDRYNVSVYETRNPPRQSGHPLYAAYQEGTIC